MNFKGILSLRLHGGVFGVCLFVFFFCFCFWCLLLKDGKLKHHIKISSMYSEHFVIIISINLSSLTTQKVHDSMRNGT